MKFILGGWNKEWFDLVWFRFDSIRFDSRNTSFSKMKWYYSVHIQAIKKNPIISILIHLLFLFLSTIFLLTYRMMINSHSPIPISTSPPPPSWSSHSNRVFPSPPISLAQHPSTQSSPIWDFSAFSICF